MSQLIYICVAIFLAELGDKTQIATMLMATDNKISPILLFFAASLGLMASTALAIYIGNFSTSYLEKLPIKLIAGSAFILIGVLYIIEHIKST